MFRRFLLSFPELLISSLPWSATPQASYVLWPGPYDSSREEIRALKVILKFNFIGFMKMVLRLDRTKYPKH